MDDKAEDGFMTTSELAEFIMNCPLPPGLGEMSWGDFKLRGDGRSIEQIERLLKIEIQFELLKRELQRNQH
jgi:hypothetical protein